jgi:hypothetical protein
MAAGLGDFFSGIKQLLRACTVGKGVGQLLDKLPPTV